MSNSTPGRKKGATKTGGRTAGTPNKVTKTVKDNVIAVFDRIGGEEEMGNWAEDNRTEFYRLYAKLLPHQIKTENTGYKGDDLTRYTEAELTEMIRRDEEKRKAEGKDFILPTLTAIESSS